MKPPRQVIRLIIISKSRVFNFRFCQVASLQDSESNRFKSASLLRKVYTGSTQNKPQCVSVSLSATVTLTEVFLIDFGQQWSVMGQRKKTWQQYMLVNQAIVDFSIFKRFVDNNKNTNHRQAYPFKWLLNLKALWSVSLHFLKKNQYRT